MKRGISAMPSREREPWASFDGERRMNRTKNSEPPARFFLGIVIHRHSVPNRLNASKTSSCAMFGRTSELPSQTLTSVTRNIASTGPRATGSIIRVGWHALRMQKFTRANQPWVGLARSLSPVAVSVCEGYRKAQNRSDQTVKIVRSRSAR